MSKAPTRHTPGVGKTQALYAIAEAIQELAKATRGSTPPASALTHDPILRSLAKSEVGPSLSEEPVELDTLSIQELREHLDQAREMVRDYEKLLEKRIEDHLLGSQ